MPITSSYDIVDGNRVDNPTDDTTYVFNPSATLKTFSLAGGTDGDTVAINALSSDFKVKFKKNEMTLIGLKNTPSFGTMVKVQFDTSNGGVDHLAFLDGTIDVQFTPNTPGALKGSWDFGGRNGIKKLNLGAEGANYVIDSSKTFADAAYAAGGALNSDTYLLTTDIDDVRIAADNTYDVIKGILNYDGSDDNSTWSVGDNIVGNGKTMLQIGVADINGSEYESPFATATGIDAFSVINNDMGEDAHLIVDGESLGTDVNFISVSGKDSFELEVNSLSAEGQLEMSIAAASDSDLYVDGTLDGVDFSVTLSNSDADAVGAVATVGLGGIDIVLGEEDNAYVNLTQAAEGDTGNISVGNLVVGDISIDAGEGADASVTVSNCAYNSGTGQATAGNLTVGNVTLDIGINASASVSLTNYADNECGDASVGNLTVGDITINTAKSGSNDWFGIYNSASAEDGNATVGNLTIGDITVNGDVSSDYALYMSAYNSASATGEGNATAGDFNVGDINVALADSYSWAAACMYNLAYADTGDAVVGDMNVGNVNVVLGNNGVYYATFDFIACASATNGNASVGDVTVGNVNMEVGSGDNSIDFCEYACAYAGAGSATVGDVVVGDITGYAGIDGSLAAYIEVCASGTVESGDTVGNITIGNVDMYGEPSACLALSVDVQSYKGSIGDVTIGDVQMEVDGSGYISLSVELTASTTIGNIKIGDITQTYGSNASQYYFCVGADAGGDIASFTVGDVTINAGKDSTDSSPTWDISAGDDIGSITIGNYSLTANSAQFDEQVWTFDAESGNIGAIVEGNTTLIATGDGEIDRSLNYSADNEIASVVIGNVSLDADGDGADIWMSHDFSASDDIGNIRLGNVTVSAAGESAYAGYSMEVDANGNDIGDVVIGNIAVSASGEDAAASALFYFSDTGDSVNSVTLGNIALNLANTADALTDAELDVQIYACGDVTIGNISLVQGAVTDDFVATAGVDASVTVDVTGDITIGNISVVGGFVNSTSAQLDDFNSLTGWLSLTAGGDITIGDVDYSGYELDATIDVSGFEGAAHVKAAQGDTTITLNDTKNIVTLYDGDDVVNVDVSTAKEDFSVAANVDEIIGFTTLKDDIGITGANGTDFAFVTSNATYAAFLTAAEDAIFNDGTDIYARKVGSDVYVAVNASGGDDEIAYVIKLTGITSVDSTDFV